MRRFLFAASMLLFSCSGDQPGEAPPGLPAAIHAPADTLSSGTESDPGEFTENIRCDELRDQNSMISLAVITAADVSPFLFSYGIDTAAMEVHEGHFTGTGRTSTAVIVKGSSNWVNGPAHLLMLFECNNGMARMIRAECIGDIDHIGDVNNDGIIDITHSDQYMHFGVLYNTIEITQYGEAKKERLFFTQSELLTDTGFFASRFGRIKTGDTIGFETRLEFNDDHGAPIEIRDYRIYTGQKIRDNELDKYVRRQADTLPVIADGKHDRKGVM